ncbi:UNVERIFIED_CONTAM: hypothetical protein K2H54_063165 [Gekko kuhli]
MFSMHMVSEEISELLGMAQGSSKNKTHPETPAMKMQVDPAVIWSSEKGGLARDLVMATTCNSWILMYVFLRTTLNVPIPGYFILFHISVDSIQDAGSLVNGPSKEQK